MTKELHLGNIANVAYGYCRILRKAGHDSSLLCYDTNHPFSQPEWHDGQFSTGDNEEETFDQNDPRYAACGPPDWYRRIRCKDFHPKPAGETELWTLDDESIDTLIHFSRRYGKRWTITREDVMSAKPLVEVLANNALDKHDVAFCYADAAIPPLLYSLKPYVPVESGTMRELPFEDSSLGRLLAFAYRTAPHVIITNPDARSAADELGVENYTFVPHPVDSQTWEPGNGEENRLLHQKYGAEYLLLAPARQDWQLKGNDKYLRAFAQLIKSGVDARLLVTGWGRELQRSKDLVEDLGLRDRVEWLNPLPEMSLLELYRGADMVLDQFGDRGTFGQITPKAMACGAPVVVSYDRQVHDWCYGEHPPLISAHAEREILEGMRRCLLDEKLRKDLSLRSRQWVIEHHGENTIVEKIEGVLEEVHSDDVLRESPFASLKQKRLELTYEEAYGESYNEIYHGGVATKMMDDVLISIVKTHLEKEGLHAPKILDLGCGPGSLTDKLLTIPNVELTGVDISPAMIRQARARFPEVRFFVDDAESLSFEDNSLDAVLCSGVLHHFPALQMSLKEIRRVLKPGGVFIAREPNERNFSGLFPELAFAHLWLRHYLLNSLGTGQPVEPEAHEYHRSFDFSDLFTEIGQHLFVTEFKTDLQVSYFYDMLTDDRHGPAVEALDRTLDGVPGLNAVVVAKKTDSVGVSDEAAKQISEQTSSNDIAAAHFLELDKFAEQSFREYKAEYFKNVKTHRPHKWVRQFIKHNPKGRILITGHDIQQCRQRKLDYSSDSRSFIGRIHDRLVSRIDRERSDCEIEVKEIGEISFEDFRQYDLGLFLVNENMPLDEIVSLMGTVRDYGLMCLEVRGGARFTGDCDNNQVEFDQLTILKRCRGIYPRRTDHILLSRNLFSPRDYYGAMAAALDKMPIDIPEADADSLRSLRARIDSKVAASVRQFGNFEALRKYPKEKILGVRSASDREPSVETPREEDQATIPIRENAIERAEPQTAGQNQNRSAAG